MLCFTFWSMSLDRIVFQLIHFYLSSPACLCVADIPTMWVFREPLIPASPWPPQPDLQYLPSPHDCHHLCVTTHPPPAGKRNHIFLLVDVHQVEPQETRGMAGSLLLETLGTFGNNVLFKLFFFHTCLVFLSFSKERAQGWTTPEPYISAVFVFIGEFYFYVGSYFEENILMFDE